jgi:hypothetical protein
MGPVPSFLNIFVAVFKKTGGDTVPFDPIKKFLAVRFNEELLILYGVG